MILCLPRHKCISTAFASAIILGLLSLAPVMAQAQARQCTIRANSTVVSFGQISIARDAPIGTPLSDVSTVSGTVTCPANPASGPYGNSGFHLQLQSRTRVSRTVPGVWETNYAGIGIRVIAVDFHNAVMSYTGPGGWTDFLPTIWNGRAYSGTYRLTHQLIKTGQITGTGQVSIGNMYSLVSHNIPDNTTSSRQVSVSLGNSPYAARTCTVTTPHVSVALPVVGPSALGTTGAAAGTTPFTINLQCGAGSNVYITLTDAVIPGNRTTLLTPLVSSTATGVRVRVRNSADTPVNFGPDSPVAGNLNQWLIGPSDSTTTIPLKAEYVSTGNATAGIVRAIATFTMSYQ